MGLELKSGFEEEVLEGIGLEAGDLAFRPGLWRQRRNIGGIWKHFFLCTGCLMGLMRGRKETEGNMKKKIEHR